jgi:hypothetical protein
MEAHGASLHTPHPDAVEFVRFCYRRRRVGWPELYDEMCAVAARGKFRGMSTDELSGLGIGFSLFDMPGLAGLAVKVIAEEQAMRRPVAVAIVAEPQPVGPGLAPSAEDLGPAAEDDIVVETDVPARVEVVPTRAADLPAEPVERSFDVPIRLVPAPA